MYVAIWAALNAAHWVGWLALPLIMTLAANRWMAVGILSHDAYHYTFHPNKKVNDFFGHLTALMIFNDFNDARRAHLAHHQHLFTEGDLDARVAREIDQLGIKGWKLWLMAPAYMFKYMGRILQIYGNAPKGFWGELRQYSLHLVLLLGLSVLDWRMSMIHVAVAYLALTFHLTRSFLEHLHMPIGVKTRSYFGSSHLLNWTIYAHNIGFHELHHRYPGIPWYNLPRVHYAGVMSSVTTANEGKAHSNAGASAPEEYVDAVFFGEHSIVAIARRYPFFNLPQGLPPVGTKHAFEKITSPKKDRVGFEPQQHGVLHHLAS
ncbi:MAG: hypothetical protein FJ146_13645 [Deltaproteobacteria bacterium]|nr:hypothetical protein [Deltaproteobacteria bacterium]